jgi:hypothetical protein
MTKDEWEDFWKGRLCPVAGFSNGSSLIEPSESFLISLFVSSVNVKIGRIWYI